MLKSCRRIVLGLLILLVGSCALVFLYYKIALDKPGFFRQFEDEVAVRDYLLDDLTLGETDRDEAIAYMHEHLSRDETCSDLRDSTVDYFSCRRSGCPAVTDETVNTEMFCLVRYKYVLDGEYRIALYFEYETLLDLEVEWIYLFP
ncbi:MAG: hypothetical protein RLP44_02050 [Aggregatilineales bacterium]